MLFVIIVDRVELKTTTARVKVAGKVQFYLSVQAMVKTGGKSGIQANKSDKGQAGGQSPKTGRLVQNR